MEHRAGLHREVKFLFGDSSEVGILKKGWVERRLLVKGISDQESLLCPAGFWEAWPKKPWGGPEEDLDALGEGKD